MFVFSDQPILQKCFLQLIWRPNWEFLIFDFDNDIVKRENCCCCFFSYCFLPPLFSIFEWNVFLDLLKYLFLSVNLWEFFFF